MLTKILKEAKMRAKSVNLPTSDIFAKHALGFSSYCLAGYWCHPLLIKSGFLEYPGLIEKGNQRQISDVSEKK